MAKKAVTDLIHHIQDVVNPSNKLPQHVDDIDAPSQINVELNEHPRPDVPDWLPGQLPDDSPITPGEELIFEPSDLDNIPDIDTSDVASDSNPDIYAYYLPFHFYRNRWGIYIKASGVLAIAAHLLRVKKLDPKHNLVVNSVYQMLLGHEAFHHKVELACSRLETPGIEYMNLNGSGSIYEWYFWNVDGGYHEEAMANAHAQHALVTYHNKTGFPASSTQGIQSLVSGFMESQPPGYCDFNDCLPNDRFNRGKDSVIQYMRDSYYLRMFKSGPDSLLLGRKYFQDKDIGACPVYLIFDKHSSSMQRVRPFPVMGNQRIIVHTREHLPPHFHLESPVGTEIGRYTWPELNPMKNAVNLSGRQKKNLRSYIDHYQPGIYKRIKSVFPGVPDIE